MGPGLAPALLVFMAVHSGHASLSRDVDAQGGAYATGVLVLITSASFAVTIAARTVLSRLALGGMTLIFIYTTLVNIYERPERLKISCIFVFTMVRIAGFSGFPLHGAAYHG